MRSTSRCVRATSAAGDEVITASNSFIATRRRDRHRRRDAGLRRRRSATRTRSIPSGIRGRDHAADEGDRARSTCSARWRTCPPILGDRARARAARSSRMPARRTAPSYRGQPGRRRSATPPPSASTCRRTSARTARAARSPPRSDQIAERVRLLRDHGSARKYEHVELGLNSRLDELQAAVLRVKLRHLSGWNARRRQHAERYAEALAGLDVVLADARGRARARLPSLRDPDAAPSRGDAVRAGLAGARRGDRHPLPDPDPSAAGDASARSTARDAPGHGALAPRILSLPMYPELEEARDPVRGRLSRDALPRPVSVGSLAGTNRVQA